MKIRNGFVSNSSSSSFVINLNKITSQQKELLFDSFKYIENDQVVSSHGISWMLEEDGRIFGNTHDRNILSNYAKEIGIDTNDINYRQPFNTEEVLDRLI